VAEAGLVEQMVSEAIAKLGPFLIMVANPGIPQVGRALSNPRPTIWTLSSASNFWVSSTAIQPLHGQMMTQGLLEEQEDSKDSRSIWYTILGATSIVAFSPFRHLHTIVPQRGSKSL